MKGLCLNYMPNNLLTFSNIFYNRSIMVNPFDAAPFIIVLYKKCNLNEFLLFIYRGHHDGTFTACGPMLILFIEFAKLSRTR